MRAASALYRIRGRLERATIASLLHCFSSSSNHLTCALFGPPIELVLLSSLSIIIPVPARPASGCEQGPVDSVILLLNDYIEHVVKQILSRRAGSMAGHTM